VLVGAIAIAALLVGALRFIGDKPAPQSPPVQEPAASAQPSPVAELPGEAKPQAEVQDDTQPSEAPAPPPPSNPKSGSVASPGPTMVRIVTNPPGAFVVVDGSSSVSCQSPCTVELPPGRHTLSATREGFRRTLRIFQTPSETELFLNLDRSTGTVVVRSEPPGASIVIDGQPRAERTPAMLTLPVGTHTLEVVGSGGRESQQITVRDAAITNVGVSLR
jgi:hypothetical protein